MKNEEYEDCWLGTLPDPELDEFWIDSLPSFDKQWLDTIYEISDNNDVKILKLLKIFKLYRAKVLGESLDDVHNSQNRKNHTGNYVRSKFALYVQEHPNEKKMNQVNNVAKALGITPKAVEKHIYKK